MMCTGSKIWILAIIYALCSTCAESLAVRATPTKFALYLDAEGGQELLQGRTNKDYSTFVQGASQKFTQSTNSHAQAHNDSAGPSNASSKFDSSELPKRNKKEPPDFFHAFVGNKNQTTRSVGNTVLNSTQQQLHAEDDHAIHHSVSKRKGATQTLFVVSQASGEVQAHVHEIELQMDSAANQSSKIALVLVEVLMLGTFGIDRCMTGQICLGFVKGLTLGACGVWTLIDYIFIIANCLGRYESLNALGYHVTFYQNGIEPAFVITLVGIIVKVCFTCALRFRAYFAVKGHMESEGLPDRA